MALSCSFSQKSLQSWWTAYSPSMRVSHTLRIAIRIPTDLLSVTDDVIPALHDHTNCLSMQSLTTGYKEVPTESDSPVPSDPYFSSHDRHDHDGAGSLPVKSYLVTEGVVMVPGIGDRGKKSITFNAWFQDTPVGVRTKVDAPMGVHVRAEYRVEKKQVSQTAQPQQTQEKTSESASSHEDDNDGNGDKNQHQRYYSNAGKASEEWYLIEDLTVECARWMMPLVRRNTEEAHREICEKIISKVKEQKCAYVDRALHANNNTEEVSEEAEHLPS